MVAGRFKEVWYHLSRWYHHTRGTHFHPKREVMYRELTVRAELHRCRTSAKLKLSILFHSTDFRDEVPTESEANMAVWEKRTGRSEGGVGGSVRHKIR